MPDTAHDTSGPASPKPGDTAPQQASRPESSDGAKLRVFISYSRDDLKFADQLDDALNACGFECVIDRHGISGGEDWKRRLGNLIREADTVVFVLSPTSARSEICDWEVEEATRLGKRILPIICQPLEGASPPPRLRERNYIYFYDDPKAAPGSGFGTGLAKLISALNTDFEWVREHTRYLQRASEWDKGGRPANRLLSGDDIADAKVWAARRPKNAPEPTALHLDFIRASEDEAQARTSAQRKQLEAMAAAQKEREKALKEAEEAQQKRATTAKIRNIALVVASILALVAGLLYFRAEQQRQIAEQQKAVAEEQRAVAEEQRRQADDILVGATKIINKTSKQVDIDTKKQIFGVFRAGTDHGDSTSMTYMGFLYEEGLGVTQDYAKAREWYEKGADKGNADAMKQLGLLHAKGFGVTKDDAKAQEWFEKAADKGGASMMTELGQLYVKGFGNATQGFGVTKDDAKAREWYEKAADKGNAEAMRGLGELYHYGFGVTKDDAKAREWYEKAADKGDAEAMTKLGVFYTNGFGVTRDDAKAQEWFEKAADKGGASMMTELGRLFSQYGIVVGMGSVMPNPAKARQWFEKAADKGDADAMRELGLLYEIVPQNYAKAREWYEKAADKGNAEAKVNLARLECGGGKPSKK